MLGVFDGRRLNRLRPRNNSVIIMRKLFRRAARFFVRRRRRWPTRRRPFAVFREDRGRKRFLVGARQPRAFGVVKSANTYGRPSSAAHTALYCDDTRSQSSGLSKCTAARRAKRESGCGRFAVSAINSSSCCEMVGRGLAAVPLQGKCEKGRFRRRGQCRGRCAREKGH